MNQLTLLILFGLFANSVVIFLYHQVHRKVTMHEIHVTHLAVADVLAGVLATFPFITGSMEALVGTNRALDMACFTAAFATHSCNMMATVICDIISYDRLRLLQLGIRYRLVHTRVFSITRLAFAWTAMIIISVVLILLITLTSLGKAHSGCGYAMNTEAWPVKLIMTGIAIGPLSVLVVLNYMVRGKLRELEERHPHVINRSRWSSLGRNTAPDAANGFTDGDTTPMFWQQSGEPTSTGGACTSIVQSEDSIMVSRQEAAEISVSNPPKSLMRSFKSDRSLSRRASASIFLSTLTFIVCLSPLSILLLLEAWHSSTIDTSIHRWHLWLTLFRIAVDPFLFARNVPSFRVQYGTSMIRWQEKWYWFRRMRFMCCFPFCFLDQGVVDDARERLDRKRRGSPALMRQNAKTVDNPVATDGQDGIRTSLLIAKPIQE
ncbi:hypothetical protein ElyMa_001987600 [Elysia marginata]|uniref:G-protein coupled receptors family 1 profile domain-containing protein n=1 Tax=Elysia marginata TaxID=1093978 RepID=A0AAV4F135_9GAST|nr:hypothetical protein ElyMa_001987600 [Elysia marginata]